MMWDTGAYINISLDCAAAHFESSCFQNKLPHLKVFLTYRLHSIECTFIMKDSNSIYN